MDISLSWLKKYVPDLNCSDQEFFDAMTLSGTKVESVSRKDKNLERIVVGKIEAISKHPDAEKLVVCKVDIGDAAKKYEIENENGLIQIVTGAPNTKIGELGVLLSLKTVLLPKIAKSILFPLLYILLSDTTY